MQVNVRCFSTLADAENCRYDQSKPFSLPEGNHSVKNLAQQIPVSEKNISTVFVNGKRAAMETTLSDGDHVAFVPPTGGM